MRKTFTRFVEGLALAALSLLNLCATSWAGPPAPPSPPGTPVGGTEVIIATTAAIAAYGIWKSRK